jgi:hypothetical protein
MRESRLFGSEGGAKLPSSLPLSFRAPLRGGWAFERPSECSPACKAAATFLPTSSSVSENQCLRSLWPITTCLTCSARNLRPHLAERSRQRA